jgi:hypothetical protein
LAAVEDEPLVVAVLVKLAVLVLAVADAVGVADVTTVFVPMLLNEA